ncbi:hypothetical protein [uncultured Jannaschia sp.]|uniref:hypothetical protein n=1 Tax=uncultured Jannaschia sp. TaxID=293347 RepID=UPI002611FB37|nr:hypothetical protein [uncultured Jannaschia sp.]
MAWVLHRLSVTDGTYRGLLTGSGAPPSLELAMDDRVLGPVVVAPAEAGWEVTGVIGTAPLTIGTHTIAVRIAGGDILDSVTIVTGLGAPEDLRAELGALRAELAVLKAAFRRHVTRGG